LARPLSFPPPNERRLRARIAAHALHAQGKTKTGPATQASQVDRFLRQVDPGSELPLEERLRRAEHARKAYMTGLALKSAQARRARKKSP